MERVWYYREGETRNVAGSEGVSPREVYKRVWCGAVVVSRGWCGDGRGAVVRSVYWRGMA